MRLLMYLKYILDKLAKVLFLQLFSLIFIMKSLQNDENRKFKEKI